MKFEKRITGNVTMVGVLDDLTTEATSPPFDLPENSLVEVRTSEPQKAVLAMAKRRDCVGTILSMPRTVRAVERRCHQVNALSHFDYVDLDAEMDLVPQVLDVIPPERRVISWDGRAPSIGFLNRTFDELRTTKAALYRFRTRGVGVGETLVPLGFLNRLGRSDVIAWDRAPEANWTRILAARFGAPVVFGALGGSPSCVRLDTMTADFGLPRLRNVRDLYAIVGEPVSKSLSPRLHNAAHEAVESDALYISVTSGEYSEFHRHMVNSPVLEELGITCRGITVASPHKRSALAFATRKSEISSRSESTNILTRRHGAWHADTTDASGLLEALATEGREPRLERTAVIGCGGSGRAIAAMLQARGAHVTLVNRGDVRGNRAAGLLKLPWVPLADFEPSEFTMLVNATPLGTNGSPLPFSLEGFPTGGIVVDLNYVSGETRLVHAARSLGIATIDGTRILFAQGRRQYELMTGKPLSPEFVREALGVEAEEHLEPISTNSNSPQRIA